MSKKILRKRVDEIEKKVDRLIMADVKIVALFRTLHSKGLFTDEEYNQHFADIFNGVPYKQPGAENGFK